MNKCGYVTVFLILFVAFSGITGCSDFNGYSDEPLFPTEVTSVYVEMFENQSFWRDVEYGLTDAISKRIESVTPYKVVSSRNRADSLLSGQIVSVGHSVLTTERETGRALEKSVDINVVVNWKDLRSGEFLIEGESLNATSSYSEWLNQGFDYASSLTSNKLSQQIVELMEKPW